VSPQASSTAKTAIYVVGGLIAITTIAGIIVFAVGANTAAKVVSTGGSKAGA
jgi:hypothetical protein